MFLLIDCWSSLSNLYQTLKVQDLFLSWRHKNNQNINTGRHIGERWIWLASMVKLLKTKIYEIPLHVAVSSNTGLQLLESVCPIIDKAFNQELSLESVGNYGMSYVDLKQFSWWLYGQFSKYNLVPNYRLLKLSPICISWLKCKAYLCTEDQSQPESIFCMYIQTCTLVEGKFY